MVSETIINEALSIIGRMEVTRGYVYLMGGNGYYKIGRSKNPKKRCQQLNQILPFSIRLMHVISTNCMQKLEQELHRKYRDCRIKNEWFALDEDNINEIRRMG